MNLSFVLEKIKLTLEHNRGVVVAAIGICKRCLAWVLVSVLGLLLTSQSSMTWAALEQHLAVNQQLNPPLLRPQELVKPHKSQSSADVWERIRLGMKISRPQQPSQELILNNHLTIQSSFRRMNQEVSHETAKDSKVWHSLRPAPAVAPMYNYTSYGRLRFSGAVALKSTNMAINKIGQQTSNDSNSALSTDLNKASSLVAPVQSLINNQYDRVNKHITWYSQHIDYLQQVSERAQPYLFHIVESLSQQQLPAELALLPIVESAYQAKALSPKSAAGLWQFMPSTGHDLDLYQTAHYDARLDIEASTQAAIRYLSFLKQHYNGDWLLALAAYNGGLGMVDNAIERNVAAGQSADYWSLQLPEETKAYVPKFLALSSIFANPKAYGLNLTPVKNEAYFVKVHIDSHYDVAYLAAKEVNEVASLADLSVEHFKRLNSGHLKAKLAPQGPFTFFMPRANAIQLRQRLASITQFFNKSGLIAVNNNAPLLKQSLLNKADDSMSLSLWSEQLSVGGLAESILLR